jgi:hypothetical protein
MTPDLAYYNLFLQSVSTEQYENQPATVYPGVTLIIKGSAAGGEALYIQFLTDAEIMNRVRVSTEPAVKEAYEQLLTVLALANTIPPTKK